MNLCPIFRIPRLMWLTLSATDLHTLSLRNCKFFMKIGAVKSTLHPNAYVEFDHTVCFFLYDLGKARHEKMSINNVPSGCECREIRHSQGHTLLAGVKWTSNQTVHICCPVWVIFATVISAHSAVEQGELREHQCREDRTFLMGVNEITFTLVL
jgi:hypothetical protein